MRVSLVIECAQQVGDPILELIVLLQELAVCIIAAFVFLCILAGFFDCLIELITHLQQCLVLSIASRNRVFSLLDRSVLECLLLLLGQQGWVLPDHVSHFRN